MPFRITRCTADRLDQRSRRTQEAFLVRIQDCDQRHFRDVQTLAQQVDADQHIKHIQTQITDDLGTLQRIDIRMQIFHADTDVMQIIRQILRHTLGQRGDHHLILLCRFLFDLRYQIVDLPFHRAHADLRIQQSRRADDLLRTQEFVLFLVLRRCCRNKHHLIDIGFKFREVKRPVVQRGRQTESIIHQRRLSCAVAVIHTADLRDRHMRLIDDDQKIILKEVHQTVRMRPCRHSRQMS